MQQLAKPYYRNLTSQICFDWGQPMTTYKLKPAHEQGLDVTIDVWDNQTIDDTPGRRTKLKGQRPSIFR
jgi:hypothetical protein